MPARRPPPLKPQRGDDPEPSAECWPPPTAAYEKRRMLGVWVVLPMGLRGIGCPDRSGFRRGQCIQARRGSRARRECRQRAPAGWGSAWRRRGTKRCQRPLPAWAMCVGPHLVPWGNLTTECCGPQGLEGIEFCPASEPDFGGPNIWSSPLFAQGSPQTGLRTGRIGRLSNWHRDQVDPASDIEQEVHHVTVSDQVVATLQTSLAPLPHGGVAARRH